MFEKTYRNKAGKSFTEGRKFNMTEFSDYYNTLTDEEWDAAIGMAEKKGYDISNIKPYIRVYGRDGFFKPLGLEEVREQLLALHGFKEVMWSTGFDDRTIDERRRSVEELYARMGRPVPEYWRAKLWS